MIIVNDRTRKIQFSFTYAVTDINYLVTLGLTGVTDSDGDEEADANVMCAIISNSFTKSDSF